MKKILTIAFILLLSNNGWAEDEQSIQKTKISNLEKQIIELQQEIKKVDKVYNVKETDLKEYIQTKYFNWYATNFFSILAIASILGIIIGFIGLRKYITSKIDKIVQKQLGTYLDSAEWTNALKAKINRQLDQTKLKVKMKIKVLSESSNEEMSLFLKKNEFSNVEYYTNEQIIKENVEILSSDSDILIINNQNDQFGLKNFKQEFGNNVDNKYTSIINLINSIKDKYPNLAVFYFNDNAVKLPNELDNGLKSSFASSFASFYHNLLDLMRYKYLVIDQKKL